MIKDFLMRKMLASKLKGVPQAEQEKLISLIQNNPDFFTSIAQEVSEHVKSGKDQMQAMMDVMAKHQEKIKTLMK